AVRVASPSRRDLVLMKRTGEIPPPTRMTAMSQIAGKPEARCSLLGDRSAGNLGAGAFVTRAAGGGLMSAGPSAGRVTGSGSLGETGGGAGAGSSLSARTRFKLFALMTAGFFGRTLPS